jgi:hypothetical protein
MLDPVWMVVFGNDVRMLVIERRRRCPEMNNNPQGLSTRIAGAYGISTRRSGSVWISWMFGLVGEA